MTVQLLGHGQNYAAINQLGFEMRRKQNFQLIWIVEKVLVKWAP